MPAPRRLLTKQPEMIFSYIASYNTIFEFAALLQTSKAIRNHTKRALTKSHRLLKLPVDESPSKAESLISFISKYLVDAPYIDTDHQAREIPSDVAFHIVQTCQSLQFLALTFVMEDVQLVQLIGEHLPHLSCLALHTMVTTHIVDEIGTHLPHLKAVHLGSPWLLSSIQPTDAAHLMRQLEELQVLMILRSNYVPSQPAVIDELCAQAPEQMKELKSLVTPYGFVRDSAIASLQSIGALATKIELNFGSDRTTAQGLSFIFKNCPHLLALSFSTAHSGDCMAAVGALTNDCELLPKLRVLGLWPFGAMDPRFLIDFKQGRPDVKLYNYRVRPYSGESFPQFEFFAVCKRAQVL